MNEIETLSYIYFMFIGKLIETGEGDRPVCPICKMPMARLATQTDDGRWFYSWMCNCITSYGENAHADIYNPNKSITNKVNNLLTEVFGEG